MAGRAAKAAQDISQLTEDSGKNVNLGAQTVERANETLNDIISEVEKTVEQIARVTEAAKKQAGTIDEISGVSAQIDTRMQDLSRPFLDAAE